MVPAFMEWESTLNRGCLRTFAHALPLAGTLPNAPFSARPSEVTTLISLCPLPFFSAWQLSALGTKHFA